MLEKHFILFLCFLINGIGYISRRSVGTLIPKIKEEYHMSKAFIGNISLFSHIGYVISKVLGNISSDYCDPKHSLVMYLFLSSLCHFFIAFLVETRSNFLIFLIFLNFLSVGGLWSAIRSLLFNWTNSNERGTYSGILTNATILGSCVISGILSLKFLNSRQTMFVFSFFIFLDMIICLFIKTKPTESTTVSPTKKSSQTNSISGFIEILTSGPVIYFLLIGEATIHICRIVFFDWINVLLFSHYHYTSGEISRMILVLEIGVNVGGILSGYISDKFQNRSVIIMSYALFGMVHTMFYSFTTNYYIVLSLLFCSGFSIGGPYALGGLQLAEYSPPNKGKITAISSVVELCFSSVSYFINKMIVGRGLKVLFTVFPLIYAFMSFLFFSAIMLRKSDKVKSE